MKSIITITTLAALAFFGTAPLARAEQPGPVAQANPPPPAPHVRHRIEIYPRPLLYRRCVDWYELQLRLSGTVVYPQMRCWWVRG
jgi:hypothetical protein